MAFRRILSCREMLVSPSDADRHGRWHNQRFSSGPTFLASRFCGSEMRHQRPFDHRQHTTPLSSLQQLSSVDHSPIALTVPDLRSLHASDLRIGQVRDAITVEAIVVSFCVGRGASPGIVVWSVSMYRLHRFLSPGVRITLHTGKEGYSVYPYSYE